MKKDMNPVVFDAEQARKKFLCLCKRGAKNRLLELLQTSNIGHFIHQDLYQKGFLQACAQGHASLVEKMVSAPGTFSEHYRVWPVLAQGLLQACKHEQAQVVQTLIAHSCIDSFHLGLDDCLEVCCNNDRVDLFEQISRICTPHTVELHLNKASQHASANIVTYITENYTCPPKIIREAFLTACVNSHLEVARVLYPLVQEPALFNEALRFCCALKNYEVASFLVLECNMEQSPALEKLLLIHPTVKEIFEKRQFAMTLNNALEEKAPKSPRAKL